MKKLILSSVILLLGLWAGAQNIKLCGTDASPLDDSIYTRIERGKNSLKNCIGKV